MVWPLLSVSSSSTTKGKKEKRKMMQVCNRAKHTHVTYWRVPLPAKKKPSPSHDEHDFVPSTFIQEVDSEYTEGRRTVWLTFSLRLQHPLHDTTTPQRGNTVFPRQHERRHLPRTTRRVLSRISRRSSGNVLCSCTAYEGIFGAATSTRRADSFSL